MKKIKGRVCYLSYDGLTDPLGQSQIIPYLKGLSADGYEITIISFEKKERFEKTAPIIRELLLTESIHWMPLFYTKRPPVLSTVFDLIRLRWKVKSLHQHAPFQLIHCRSYLTALIGLHLKRTQKVPFLFDMRGFWADERIDGSIWKLSNPVYRFIYQFFKRQEIAFMENANTVVSLTHAGKEEIEGWNQLKNKPNIVVIPCCVDTNLFEVGHLIPEKVEALKIELQPTNQPLILYVGSIGTWYLLEEMLLFFKSYLVPFPQARFVFVTPEPAEMVFNKANELNIPISSLVVRFANRKEVPYFIAACTFSLFFIKQAYSKLASSPTKQGEIMAMGKPVICNSGVGDTASIVEKYHAGYVIHGFSQLEINKLVDSVSANSLLFDAAEIRKGAIEFYGLETGIKRYGAIYESIIKK